MKAVKLSRSLSKNSPHRSYIMINIFQIWRILNFNAFLFVNLQSNSEQFSSSDPFGQSFFPSQICVGGMQKVEFRFLMTSDFCSSVSPEQVKNPPLHKFAGFPLGSAASSGFCSSSTQSRVPSLTFHNGTHWESLHACIKEPHFDSHVKVSAFHS